MKSTVWTATLLLAAGILIAQESKDTLPEPAEEAKEWAKAPRAPIRLQVVISRHQGEKKVSSRTYTIHQFAEQGGTSLRLGAQVPFQASSPQGPTVAFKDVGVKVSCNSPIRHKPDGRFHAVVQVEDSSALPLDAGPGPKASGPAAGPVVQTLNVLSQVVLRDGESAPLAAGIDPVTGDTVKVDVTLNVTK